MGGYRLKLLKDILCIATYIPEIEVHMYVHNHVNLRSYHETEDVVSDLNPCNICAVVPSLCVSL